MFFHESKSSEVFLSCFHIISTPSIKLEYDMQAMRPFHWLSLVAFDRASSLHRLVYQIANHWATWKQLSARRKYRYLDRTYSRTRMNYPFRAPSRRRWWSYSIQSRHRIRKFFPNRSPRFGWRQNKRSKARIITFNYCFSRSDHHKSSNAFSQTSLENKMTFVADTTCAAPFSTLCHALQVPPWNAPPSPRRSRIRTLAAKPSLISFVLNVREQLL